MNTQKLIVPKKNIVIDRSNQEEAIWLLRTFRRLFEQLLGQTVEYNINVDLELVNANAKTAHWRNVRDTYVLVNIRADNYISIPLMSYSMPSGTCKQHYIALSQAWMS